MGPSKTLKFVNTYRKFYLKYNADIDLVEEDYDTCGIPRGVKPIEQALEDHIISKIGAGIYDEEAFAWKAGKAKWANNHFDYDDPLPDRWVNGEGRAIKEHRDAPDFSREDFVNYLNNQSHNSNIHIDDYDFYNSQDRKAFYIALTEKYNLYNFGSINIINMMFFMSKGAIPIYDYFAHLAVKALYLDKSPLEVVVNSAPGKNEHPRGGSPAKKRDYYLAVNALEEYMWMLKEVFPKEIHKKGSDMYISRAIDQSLWVYGHAYKQFPPIN